MYIGVCMNKNMNVYVYVFMCIYACIFSCRSALGSSGVCPYNNTSHGLCPCLGGSADVGSNGLCPDRPSKRCSCSCRRKFLCPSPMVCLSMQPQTVGVSIIQVQTHVDLLFGALPR